MRLVGHVKTRQISWDVSVNWERARTEPESLWTDSRKQKILLVKYTSRGKPGSPPNNPNRKVTLAPEIKELKLVDREGLQNNFKEQTDPGKAKSDSRLADTKSRKLLRGSNTVTDLAAIGSSIADEKGEECLYCHMKNPLGTNHNTWCRKLLSINKLYTQYNLSLASRWKAPKGFSGKKQIRFRGMAKKSFREGGRRTLKDGTADPDPISPPPPQTPSLGAFSPAFGERSRGWDDRGNCRGKRAMGQEKCVPTSQFILNIDADVKSDSIPTCSPLPFKTDSPSRSPERYTVCALCHADPLTKIDQRHEMSPSDGELEEICDSTIKDPKIQLPVLDCPSEVKKLENPVFKEFRDPIHNYKRAVPSPITPPPPPTPVIGTGRMPPADLARAYCYEANDGFVVPSKAMKYKYTINGKYPQPLWYPQTVEHKARGNMFKPHPPLKNNLKNGPRTPSPGTEFVLERLGLKYKVPCLNQSVLKTKPKRSVEPKQFIGKPGRFLPPIVNEENDKFLFPVPPVRQE